MKGFVKRILEINFIYWILFQLIVNKHSCPRCGRESAWIKYEKKDDHGKEFTVGYCRRCKITWEIERHFSDDKDGSCLVEAIYEDFLDNLDKRFNLTGEPKLTEQEYDDWDFVDHKKEKRSRKIFQREEWRKSG